VSLIELLGDGLRQENLSGFQTPTGTIIVDDPRKSEARDHLVGKTVIYTRVSAAENKSNLEGQAKRIRDYYAAKGYPVSIIVKEIGSGVNDSRPKLLRILKDPSISQIVVEHKDRLTRFGFRYLKQLLAMQGRRIEVIRADHRRSEPRKEIQFHPTKERRQIPCNWSKSTSSIAKIQDFPSWIMRHFFPRTCTTPQTIRFANRSSIPGSI
jgi:hypothetical protein